MADSAMELMNACRAIALDSNATAANVAVPATFESGRCWGAFAVVQQATTHIDTDKRPLYGACPPPQSTRLQFVRIFHEYSQRNPHRSNDRFFEVALDAIRSTFPCPRRP
jgi:hypothetical protein